MKKFKRVLSIAGSDSGGGAGIQADIKSISACGCFAMTAITSITAQNTCGVDDIEILSVGIVEKQIKAVIEDIGVDAVKLGMLPTADIVVAVARLLKKYNVRNVVMDPVIVSTSGCKLISDEAAEAIITHILPLSDLVTPNIPETEYFTGISPTNAEEFKIATQMLYEKGVKSVLIKAGHLNNSKLTDYLFSEESMTGYSYDRIDTQNTHGTGCTLSSAIASFLAQGFDIVTAVGLAENYVHKAILNGVEYTTGHGHGPVHHFFKFWE